ncbi:bifunctional diguanylate cyclase/phosphodiesterase [Ahrensia sp. 13_GOM-1096m]|uniref:putative bifunctional diguanylate cyclase/phosphodiesterase n=1 Tax=Ahrensia sp. 13_GOM-1096m TaxID=1380380 RepID=UPI000686C54A|nr:GGDEF domain-containing phosphodiesterase [Ahrensia sp. 13_GOM-1096m]
MYSKPQSKFKKTILNRLREKRRNPTVGRLLSIRDSGRNRELLRVGMWLAALSYIFYGVFDWYLFPDINEQLVILRVLLGVVTVSFIEIALFLKRPLKELQWLGASAIVIGSLTWLIVARQTTFQVNFALFSVYGAIFILGTNLYFRFKFHIAVIASLAITVSYACNAMYIDNLPHWVNVTTALFFINCFVLSLYVSWQMDAARYDHFLSEFDTRQRTKKAIKHNQTLLEIAETDPLTGLANRRAIERKFSLIVDKRKNDSEYCGVLLIDADYFKSYNDLLGHQAGDTCLQAMTAALLRVAERYNAIVGRHGGEEFIIICTMSASKELKKIAAEVCDEVRNMNMAHPGRTDALSIITVSVGATYAELSSGPTLVKLTEEADHALYRAKSGGRATFRVFDDHTISEDHSSYNVLKSIENVISENRINAVYQPLIDANTGHLFGHETLMRILDKNGNNISPEFFIPIAEESGLLCELGEWIIDQACYDYGRHPTGEVISVNVSVVQLRKPGFPLTVMSSIQRHGLLPQNLAIEITETINILEDELVRNAIRQLRSNGIKIWLDDFGTGYAGLKWLRDIEFDLVKIDRLFLHDSSNSQGEQMLQDIITLAKNRGLSVLVEGVEKSEQQVMLKALGVDYMQGYHIGVPANRFCNNLFKLVGTA